MNHDLLRFGIGLCKRRNLKEEGEQVMGTMDLRDAGMPCNEHTPKPTKSRVLTRGHCPEATCEADSDPSSNRLRARG